MVLAEGDQWHPGNAEALGDEGMAITKSSLSPGVVQVGAPCEGHRDREDFLLPIKHPGSFQSVAGKETPGVLAQPPQGPQLGLWSVLVSLHWKKPLPGAVRGASHQRFLHPPTHAAASLPLQHIVCSSGAQCVLFI